MILDHPTLKLAGGFVTVASGLFLMTHWWRDRSAWPAFWWAAANLVSGIGIGVMAAHDMMPGPVWRVAAPIMIGVGPALMCVAAWIFETGTIDPSVASAAFTLWLALSVVAGVFGYARAEVILGPGVSGVLCLVAAALFWRGRRESLGGRMPMIGVLGLQGFALLLLGADLSSISMLENAGAMSGIFSLIKFAQLVYAAGGSVFLVTMLKERSEAEHKAASLSDPLTGLPNRRAFMERAQRYIDRCHHDRTPVSLLAFDLDQFKSINDTFGHPFGDQVLRIFGDVLSRVVRPTDGIARIGGEEFLVLLPNCDSGAALAVAERVRLAFEADAIRVKDKLVNAKVSGGVTTGRSECLLAELIEAADDALYRAKALGRNRVVLAPGVQEAAA